jgi:hypothetical protein
MRRCRGTILGAWTLAVLPGLAGCADSTSAPHPGGASSAGIEKSVERGPVRLIVRTDKSQITIAERLELMIEAAAPEGIDIRMPEFGTELNEFQIRDFRDEPARVVSDGRLWRQTYDLDIFLSGEYALPAITVQFTDRRGDEPIEGELATEPFSITVASLLDGEFDPTKFRDIKGPVELPAEPMSARAKWLIAGAAAAVIAGAIGAWWLRRRRRAAAPPQPAHEWAFDQLQQLIEDHLIEQGQIREFYFRLSLIVRLYIERRFGLMAPERTTEEFLAEARSDPSLTGSQKDLLGAFLRAADMVKFARHQPEAREIERAFDTARDFVEQTAAPTQADTGLVEAAA